MKLFYAPGACSLGIHVLLEEIGKPYQALAISLKDGGQFKPEFTSVNPKSKVPTLVRDDGSVLTEFPAIAYWLARSNPDSELLPTDIEGQARVLEAMDYIVATIHMRGFTRLFRPGNFSPNAADAEKVKAQGHDLIEKGLALVEKTLAGKEYIVGRFSIADAALFYVELWSQNTKISLPQHCAAHLARMQARPAVQRVLKAEGLAA